MIVRIVMAAAIIALALSGWLLVQGAARRFAARHPEFGPLREDGSGGCGSCADHGRCERRDCDDT